MKIDSRFCKKQNLKGACVKAYIGTVKKYEERVFHVSTSMFIAYKTTFMTNGDGLQLSYYKSERFVDLVYSLTTI